MSNHGHDFRTVEQRLRTNRLKKIKFVYVAWTIFCSWCQKEVPAASNGNMTCCSVCGN